VDEIFLSYAQCQPVRCSISVLPALFVAAQAAVISFALVICSWLRGVCRLLVSPLVLVLISACLLMFAQGFFALNDTQLACQ
jgi:hypothetical protein